MTAGRNALAPCSVCCEKDGMDKGSSAASLAVVWVLGVLIPAVGVITSVFFPDGLVHPFFSSAARVLYKNLPQSVMLLL